MSRLGPPPFAQGTPVERSLGPGRFREPYALSDGQAGLWKTQSPRDPPRRGFWLLIRWDRIF